MGLSALPRDRSASGSPDVSAALASLLAARPIRDCLQWFQRERKWINERHLELCRIAAPTFFEQKRAEWMAAQFRALGWDTQIDKAGNVVAFSHSSRQAPAVAATAHLDTVLAPR